LGMAGSDPNLVLKDVSGVLVSLLPACLRFELRPILAVLRVPDVRPVLAGIVRPTAEDPDAVAIDHRRKPDPRRPGSLGRYLGPVNAILGGPDIVFPFVLRHIIAAAEHPDFTVVHHGIVIRPWGPTGVIGLLLPLFAVDGRPDIVLQALLV